MNIDMPYSISGSDGTSLRFTEDEYVEYKRELHLLEMKYYAAEIIARGIWASNQGRYVATEAELNNLDCREMYNRYKGMQ